MSREAVSRWPGANFLAITEQTVIAHDRRMNTFARICVTSVVGARVAVVAIASCVGAVARRADVVSARITVIAIRRVAVHAGTFDASFQPSAEISIVTIRVGDARRGDAGA